MRHAARDRTDAAYSLLGDARRRYLLYQLVDAEYETIDDVVDRIVALEREVDGDLPDDHSQRVYISLVHNHLPRLADHGVIEYDLRSGDVVMRDGFDQLELLLEQFKETESVPAVRELSPS